MAYSSNPVKIPEVAGKISFMKKTDRTYVRYEFGRTYNPDLGISDSAGGETGHLCGRR